MLSIIPKSIMFFSSYIPLYTILFIQYFDFSDKIFNQPLLLILAVITISSLVLHIILLNLLNNQPNLVKRIEIRNVRPLKESNLTYLLSNILPLVAFDFTNKQQIACFLVIFFVLLLMYVKYNLIVYNFTNELFGYTNYSAELYSDGEFVRDIVVISKDKFNHQNTYYNIKGIQLDNELWYAIKKIIE